MDEFEDLGEERKLAIRIIKKLMRKKRKDWNPKEVEIWRKLRDIILTAKEFDVD